MPGSHKTLSPILKTLFLIIKTVFEARCKNSRGAESNVNLQTFDPKFNNLRLSATRGFGNKNLLSDLCQ